MSIHVVQEKKCKTYERFYETPILSENGTYLHNAQALEGLIKLGQCPSTRTLNYIQLSH